MENSVLRGTWTWNGALVGALLHLWHRNSPLTSDDISILMRVLFAGEDSETVNALLDLYDLGHEAQVFVPQAGSHSVARALFGLPPTKIAERQGRDSHKESQNPNPKNRNFESSHKPPRVRSRFQRRVEGSHKKGALSSISSQESQMIQARPIRFS